MENQEHNLRPCPLCGGTLVLTQNDSSQGLELNIHCEFCPLHYGPYWHTHGIPDIIRDINKGYFGNTPRTKVTDERARRERIATKLMAGLYANPNLSNITAGVCSGYAVEGAESLTLLLDSIKGE